MDAGRIRKNRKKKDMFKMTLKNHELLITITAPPGFHDSQP